MRGVLERLREAAAEAVLTSLAKIVEKKMVEAVEWGRRNGYGYQDDPDDAVLDNMERDCANLPDPEIDEVTVRLAAKAAKMAKQLFGVDISELDAGKLAEKLREAGADEAASMIERWPCLTEKALRVIKARTANYINKRG